MRVLLAGRKMRAVSVPQVNMPHQTDTRSIWRRIGVGRQALTLAALALGLGLLVVANFQSKPSAPVTNEEYPRQIAAGTIQRLETEQAELKRQIAELRRRVSERQEQAVASQTALGGINQALEAEKVAAGMTALKGAGLRIVLDDSATKSIPAGDDPAFYIVHEYQLRDVVNLLWSARAEAIAINNERLVSTSSIYCVGSTILVNDTRLSAPYELSVIGDPQAMDEALASQGNLKSLKTRVKVYGLQFKASRQREITVPAYNGSMVLKYSSVVNSLGDR